MEHEQPKMRPIWYFVGLMLVAMGGVVTISGISRFFVPAETRTVLADLHPDFWWGLVMVIGGVLFLLTNRKTTAS